jgi:hypothetical protein
MVDQTVTRWRYRVELSTRTVFGAVTVEAFDGATWDEALSKTKAPRPPFGGE